MAGGASSSSSSGNHDVFISFRGEDTRKNFTCHLHGALTGKNIKAFIDYELHKGDEISPSLLRAIEESNVSVVVFSENYAGSKWCLEELVKIVECRRDDGQVVIPVFYEIHPSHVRNQTGSYKEAFEKHEKNSRVEMNKVQKWKDALTEAANLAGWDSDTRSYRDDYGFIQEIVKDVLQKLDCRYPPSNSKGLVGISRNFKDLELKLRESRSVGIWGMGGIGKTTIAQCIFDEDFRQYDGSCFLGNVREKSGECGRVPENLRNELYSKLLGESTTRSTFGEQRLLRQNNLIVLDDVSDSQQVEDLVGELQSFSPDSRIIITTRDKSVLESAGVERIYTMKELDDAESLKLFCLKAFTEECPKIGYEEMSHRAIAYCKGIPLALTILGSFLKPKSEIEWESELKKLEKIPNEKIQNVLKLSYYGLSHAEQQIFLDIACFFKGEKKEHVIDVLDSCGLSPIIDMRSLHDKSLINYSSGFVWMHDLIQEMGRGIVQLESINPGKQSRLWDFDEICDVLENNKGTDAIEGIKLVVSKSKQNLRLSSDVFKKMSSLKYLSNMCGCLEFPDGLESLPKELRYIKWHGYPSQSLPSKFCAKKLVTLLMYSGKFKQLWDGVQNLVNLKTVKLIRCEQLMELPDFSQAQKLKIVNLYGCIRLRHVHPSILSLGMLEELCLDKCKELETLKSEIHLRSLKKLSVLECKKLWEFSVSAEEVEDLNLTTSRIIVLGSSIGRFKKVKTIDLSWLQLMNLPKELSCLKSLEKLKLSGCGEGVSKQNLHHIFDGLQSLLELYLDYCKYLFELPDNISCLSSLTVLVLDESNVEKLPESIKDLSTLKRLSLKRCSSLQILLERPSSICHLDTVDCPLLQHENLPKELSCLKSLETLELSGCGKGVSKQNLYHIFDGLQSLLELYLDDCKYLFELPDNISCLSSLTVLVLDKSNVEKLPESIKDLSTLKRLSLRGCRFLQILPELPSSICHLDTVNCPLLQALPPELFNSALQEKHKYVSFQKWLNLDQENLLHQYLSERVQNCLNLDQENSLHQYLSEQVQNCLNLDQENSLPQYLRLWYQFGRRQPRWKNQLQVQNCLNLDQENSLLQYLRLWYHFGRTTQPRLKNQLLIAYPGHKVPNWFTHQSKGARVRFTLPSPSDHYLGFLLCVVRSPPTSPSSPRPINIRWICYLEDGSEQHSIKGIAFESGIEETGWYRVCISYESGRILEKTNACRANNPSASNSYNPEVTFEFYDQDLYLRPLIKECGVHIVNASNYQTNEVGAGRGTKRQRHEDIPGSSEYTKRGVESKKL